MTNEITTINEMVTVAASFNYSPRTKGNGNLSFAKCPDCTKRLKAEHGPQWFRNKALTANRAVIFERGQEKLVACLCGHRNYIPRPGGKAKVQQANTAVDKKPIKFVNKCVGKGCNNDLPEGRKSYCYACRPATKTNSSKEAQSGTAY